MKCLKTRWTPFLGAAVKWSAFVILLTCFTALCLARRTSRILPLRVIQLPAPTLKGSFSLEESFARYRSVRELSGQPLDFVQIGQLAWAGQGIKEGQRDFRKGPTGDLTYPIRLYFATQGGIFFYNPDEHSLVQTSNRDARPILATATAEQKTVAEAACDIIIAGPARKFPARFRKQAKKYLLLAAGHIAQNIQLQALSLQLGSIAVSSFDPRGVSKSCRLPKDSAPIYMICVGYPAEQAMAASDRAGRIARRMGGNRRQRAVLIIPRENFRDEELFETKRELEQMMIETVTASTKTGLIRGMMGNIAEAALLVKDIVVDDYDAVIWVGGPGARAYFGNMTALAIVREAADKGKVLAAISTAPTILARAGVLQGVRATSSPSERAKLQRGGAIYTGAPVEQDGPIITGAGPEAVGLFARAVADSIAARW